MDEAGYKLSKSVAHKVRPRYLSWLKRNIEVSKAYELAYDEVVDLVARAQQITVDKARFASRDVLQEAMQLVTV